MLQRLPPAGKVLIVDDHPLFRQAMMEIVNRIAPLGEVLDAATLKAARSALSENPETRFVLLDLYLPDCNGFAGFLELSAYFPHVPIVMVSESNDPNTIRKGLTLGARGFIPKTRTSCEIHAALTAIISGEIGVPAGSALNEPYPDFRRFASLTPMEAKVLLGLRRGLRNQDIAAEIGLVEASIKRYVTSVMEKLGVQTRLQAVLASRALALPEPVLETTP